MSRCGVAQLTAIVRDVGGDSSSASLGNHVPAIKQPIPGKISSFCLARDLQREHDSMGMFGILPILQPGIFGNQADPGMRRIQEIEATLDVNATSFHVIWNRCFGRCHLALPIFHE